MFSLDLVAAEQSLSSDVMERFEQLLTRRYAGDRSGDAELVQLIHQYPSLAETLGDVGRKATGAWLNFTAGTDAVFRAALEEQVASLRNRFQAADDD